MGKTALAVLALAALVGALAAGCGRGTGGGETEVVEALVPCGQIGPFTEVARLFEEANPGVKVEWAAENMVVMTSKVLDGRAKPDVFLSMGDLEMDQLEAAGLVVPETRTPYAENSLALMVPKGNPAGVTRFEDLAKPSVRAIAVADPEQNSVGKHAMDALQSAGLWEQVKGKLLVARFAADGKDVTARGDVQASIGYYPCSVEVHVPGQEPAEPRKLTMVGQIPAEHYPPFWCEAAVVAGSRNPKGGRRLIEFLGTPEAQEVFVKWAFVRYAGEESGGRG